MVETRRQTYTTPAAVKPKVKPKAKPKAKPNAKPNAKKLSEQAMRWIAGQHESIPAFIKAFLSKNDIERARMSGLASDPVKLAGKGKVEVHKQISARVRASKWLNIEAKAMCAKYADVDEKIRHSYLMKYFKAKYWGLRRGTYAPLKKATEKPSHDAAWLKIEQQLARTTKMSMAEIRTLSLDTQRGIDAFFYQLTDICKKN